jgi:hypothetical protein
MAWQYEKVVTNAQENPTLRLSMLATAVMPCLFATASLAQHADTTAHSGDNGISLLDAREALHFPPEMQSNFLGNMRDHLQTLDGILQAVAGGNFAKASRIASERLGLDFPSAAGCKPADAATTGDAVKAKPTPGSMDEMMALYTPLSPCRQRRPVTRRP